MIAFSRRENLRKALGRCEKLLEDEKKEYKVKAILEFLYSLLTIMFIVVAGIFSDLNGFLTTTGMGGLSFAVEFESWKKAIRNYLLDPLRKASKFKRTRVILEMCRDDDHKCFDVVKGRILKFLEVIDEQASKEEGEEE